MHDASLHECITKPYKIYEKELIHFIYPFDDGWSSTCLQRKYFH